MAQRVLDVAIVGGGVSGVWCGWRLTGGGGGVRHSTPSVELFELSDRIGGRLLSVELPGAAGVACELGGMRYMSSQPMVQWLVEQVLGLATMPAPVAEANNIAYLRGKRLRVSDLTNADAIPYNLTDAERSGIASLIGDAIDKIAPGAKGLTGDALRKAVRTATFDGKPLYEQGFWNALARTMSGEAHRFTADSGGYDTTELNWNGADTVVLNADFAPGVDYKRVQAGYEQVPRLLAAEFEAQGGAIHMGHGVEAIDLVDLGGGETGVRLTVRDMDRDKVRRVVARNVVLAMPRRSLELLGTAGPVLGDPGLQRLITTVTPIPLYKAFVAYHCAWWEPTGVTSGRSVTDLPLRQTYYWSSNGEANSVLLATYDDTLNVGFWQGLAGDPRHYGLRVDHLPADARRRVLDQPIDDRWMAQRAPAALVDEIHRQLQEVHGVSDAPAPYAAIYHDWIGDPYGGGVNFWNIGVPSWKVIPKMAHPVAHAPVYVCGEAYSDTQGWVEGALRTAEIVLTKHLGLPKLRIPTAPSRPAGA